jgi:beta-lactamase class C
MSFFIKTLIFFILFFSIRVGWAAPPLQEQVQAFLQTNNIPGAAILLYKEGKMHAYYFGEAVPEKHIPVSEQTIFEVGSITKTFTGLLLAQNVIQNQMNLEDPVSGYLQLNVSPGFSKITLLALATYTAGLPFNAPALHYNAAASRQNGKTLLHFVQHWKAPYQPGSKILYSNVGFGLLGTALSNNRALPLPQLMQQIILGPLGMHNSGLDLSPPQQINLAQGFTAEGRPVSSRSSGLLGGAWAMKASVADLEAYLKAALMLPEIPANITQAMKVSQTAYCTLPGKWSVGLAWKIIPLESSETVKHLIKRPQHQGGGLPLPIYRLDSPAFYSNAVIEKTGATDGFRAYIAVIPKTQTGLVFVMNRFTGSAADFTNMAHRILLQESGMY